MGVAVGIDLGTTNTVVSAVQDGVAFSVADMQDRRLIPSVVSFHPSGNVLVGYAANERRLIDAENTVFSVKRLIGRAFNSEEVQKARGRFSFQIAEGPKHDVVVRARGQEYTLPELSAFVLRYAKAAAEAAIGQPVDRAVITVPANFNDHQRAATKVAGKLAGLDVLRILNEPTAAALAYGQGAGEGRDPGARERVVVYDLGGGTFDVTLLDLSGAVFEVLATAGDMALGGDDFDQIIAERMCEEFLKKHRYDPRTNPQAYGALRFAAERVKKELSDREETLCELKDVATGVGGKSLHLSFRMTRTELEWATLALVDRTFKVCEAAMARASLGPDGIDRVILVGGSTRMPMVARRVEQFFKKQPVLKVNPDEVVALGAAMQASALDRTTRRRVTTGSVSDARIADGSLMAARAPRVIKEAKDDPKLPGLPVVGPLTKGSPSAATDDRALPGLPIIGVGGAQLPEAAPKTRAIGAIKLERRYQLRQSNMIAAREEAPVPPRGALDPRSLETPSNRSRAERAKPQPDLGRLERVEDRTPDAVELLKPAGRPLVFDMGVERAGSPRVEPRPSPRIETLPEPPLPPSAAPEAPAPPSATSASGDLSFIADLDLPPTPTREPSRAEPMRLEPSRAEAPRAEPSRAANVSSLQTSLTSSIARAPAPKPPLLIDVAPLSLNVETVGGFCDALIASNTPVPCDRTRVFATASDNQTAVFIRVAQGDSTLFRENTFLGELELSGLTAASRGETRVSVTFEIDADGILNVRAKDPVTGRETKARMHVFGAQIEDHEIDQMRARQDVMVVG